MNSLSSLILLFVYTLDGKKVPKRPVMNKNAVKRINKTMCLGKPCH